MATNEFNQSIIDEFRANGGKVGGPFAGATLCILTTKGAKTGVVRENPLACFEDDGRLLVVASFAGAPRNPPWFYNLVANPEVTVELGTERFKARAAVLDEQDRAAAYEEIAARAPVFAEYQQKTSRTIPVVALERMA